MVKLERKPPLGTDGGERKGYYLWLLFRNLDRARFYKSTNN